MRPLRLLLSLSTSLTAVSLLLYLAFGEQDEEEQHVRDASAEPARSRFNALFSFTSPGSLFPPSAIISLTDDNSTFFLARPAAFGPVLPSTGLSGALWIGSGFGDETMGRGELGCSDVPGWDGGSGDGDMLYVDASVSDTTLAAGQSRTSQSAPQPKRRHEANDASPSTVVSSDGTDDHLHRPSTSDARHAQDSSPSAHADIQSLQEGAEIAGKVVLLKRGGCGFLEKVLWAQSRGGVALIVGDDVRGGGLVRMYARGDTSNVTIPALFTSHTTAHLLSSLLPTGGIFQNLAPEEAAKPSLIKGSERSKPKVDERLTKRQEKSWFDPVLSAIGYRKVKAIPSGDSRRPPGSGTLEWGTRDEEGNIQLPARTDSTTRKVTPVSTPAEFALGGQAWPGTVPLPKPNPTSTPQTQRPTPDNNTTGGNARPSSGEYTTERTSENSMWLSKVLGGKLSSSPELAANSDGSDAIPSTHARSRHDGDSPAIPEPHEGLWVTLTPTNMSTSPFFDTLLVLVVSPLVTLTVVYALLLLRSRIRRRRWRAPKSLVERLPIRTYHTISDSSPAATPNASSPSTPLLQHSPPRRASSRSQSRTGSDTEVPATSSSFLQPNRTPEEEKRESGLAAWRRRYGGRQRECVVCLEEYEDGVSQVMSLPCGHEFHADCITPWLVTRRRTCPICKGDVVRSLSQSYHDRTVSAIQSRFHDEVDEVQAQAAETRNDSPSASRPLPISSDSLAADIEANWADEDDEQDRDMPRRQGGDLSSSLRDVSSSVATTIWRGFEVVGRATGLQRRPSGDLVDRDR